MYDKQKIVSGGIVFSVVIAIVVLHVLCETGSNFIWTRIECMTSIDIKTLFNKQCKQMDERHNICLRMTDNWNWQFYRTK